MVFFNLGHLTIEKTNIKIFNLLFGYLNILLTLTIHGIVGLLVTSLLQDRYSNKLWRFSKQIPSSTPSNIKTVHSFANDIKHAMKS